MIATGFTVMDLVLLNNEKVTFFEASNCCTPTVEVDKAYIVLFNIK